MRKTKAVPPPKSSTQFAPPVVQDPATSDRSPPRLIDKPELLRRVPVTFPTIWRWMREGRFPRSRNIGGKSCWVEQEITSWITSRPIVALKSSDSAGAR